MLSIIFRAALLEPAAFQQLRQSESSAVYAFAAVAAAALAFAAGMWVLASRTVENPPLSVAPLAIAAVMLSWVIWTFVSYFVGSRLMGGKATYRQLFHALGVSYGPGLVMVSVALPFAGPISFSFSTFWVLAVGIIAVREAQQVKLQRVIIPTIIGWLPLLWLTWVLIFLVYDRAAA